MIKIKRHNKILQIIEKYEIETQDELLKKLNQIGANVTQATVSRDIKELHLVKVLTKSGKYKYKAAENLNSNHFKNNNNFILSNINSISHAGNTVVIKCTSNLAKYIAKYIESLNLEYVLGCIAGVDTIFVLVKNELQASKFALEIKNLNNN